MQNGKHYYYQAKTKMNGITTEINFIPHVGFYGVEVYTYRKRKHKDYNMNNCVTFSSDSVERLIFLKNTIKDFISKCVDISQDDEKL